MIDDATKQELEVAAGWNPPTDGPTDPTDKYQGVPPVEFTYRNHRGAVERRRVIPVDARFGSTEWRPEPQWLLDAYDVDRRAYRTFALADVLTPPAPPAGLVWRAEPPDRPGRWLESVGPRWSLNVHCLDGNGVGVFAAAGPRPGVLWFGPIPDETDAPDPLDLVVTAVGPDEALAGAAAAFRAEGGFVGDLAANVLDWVAIALRDDADARIDRLTAAMVALAGDRP